MGIFEIISKSYYYYKDDIDNKYFDRLLRNLEREERKERIKEKLKYIVPNGLYNIVIKLLK